MYLNSHLQTSEMKPHVLAREDQKLEVEPEVAGKDGSSACLEEEMNNISSLGSAGSSSDNCLLSFGITFLLSRQAYLLYFCFTGMFVTLQLHPEPMV